VLSTLLANCGAPNGLSGQTGHPDAKPRRRLVTPGWVGGRSNRREIEAGKVLRHSVQSEFIARLTDPLLSTAKSALLPSS